MTRRRARLFATLALALAATAAAAQGTAMFGGFLAQSNNPIGIDADLLQWTQRDGRDLIEYTGNVVATRGDMVIRASTLTVYLPTAGAGVTFDRIEATGNVTIVAGPQRASAQEAVMDMAARTVVMTGAVTLNDGVNQMSGERLTIDLTTGNWQIEAGGDRVRTTINPGQ